MKFLNYKFNNKNNKLYSIYPEILDKKNSLNKTYKNKIIDLKDKIKKSQNIQEKKKFKKELTLFVEQGKTNLDADLSIKVENLYKYYYNKSLVTKVLDNISFEIPKSKITMILGPSGSGKTTLLNIISGLDFADAGSVISNNWNLSFLNEKKRINFRAQNIAFVFQSYNIIDSLNVWDNVKLGKEVYKKDSLDIASLLKGLRDVWT